MLMLAHPRASEAKFARVCRNLEPSRCAASVTLAYCGLNMFNQDGRQQSLVWSLPAACGIFSRSAVGAYLFTVLRLVRVVAFPLMRPTER